MENMEKVYDEVTEAKCEEAHRLLQDSSITKAKVAEMIGVRHDELCEKLDEYRSKLAKTEEYEATLTKLNDVGEVIGELPVETEFTRRQIEKREAAEIKGEQDDEPDLSGRTFPA